MAENTAKNSGRRIAVRHAGRGTQVIIYLGKLLRMFVYQSDWKVIPMSVLVASLVGIVIRKRFFLNMEGTVMGSFAMVCVAIWNGAFNSIQVICRERDVIKREHRSGMHISSYIFSHMVYQAILCLAQTVVTLYITRMVHVQYPSAGLVTPWFLVDFGISLFLITFASDMLSLWVSCLARTTTTAMTIMPFVLIFQLVFSGGMLTLPEWTRPLTYFTISNPGLKVVAAQSNTNNLPYATVSTLINKMRDSEVGGTVTVGEVLDLLSNTDNEQIAKIRNMEVGKIVTLGEIKETLDESQSFAELKEQHILEDMTVEDVVQLLMTSEELEEYRGMDFGVPGFTLGKLLEDITKNEKAKPLLGYQLTKLTTVGDVLDFINAQGLLEQYADATVGGVYTVGELVDKVAENGDVQAMRDQSFTVKTTLGKVLDIAGEENVKTFLETNAAEASYNPDYEYSADKVADYWGHLVLFVLAFAALSTITLEFIDKDKR